jgi:hypothetical protein
MSKTVSTKKINTVISEINDFLESPYVDLLKQQYLTPELAAQIICVKPSLLSNWRVSGGGPAYIKLGAGKRALVRYPLLGTNGLINYMESRIQRATCDINAKKLLATSLSCGNVDKRQE